MAELDKSNEFLDRFKAESQRKSRDNKLFLEKLRKRPPNDLDEVVEAFHDDAFTRINCLDCANCCKTTSPIVIDRDIDRIARHLRLKPSQLIAQYLKMDEEGDYVFTTVPCPFLMADNYCMIYDDRPRACREYPHTNRKRFHQILKLTWHNTLVCPAVLNVMDGLKVKYLR